MENTNNVYIMSLEGADLYNHMIRGKKLKKDYVGMLPYSLELIKLRSEGLKTTSNKKVSTGVKLKDQSDDIINVKFKQKVQSGLFIIEKLEEKILNLVTETEKYIEIKTKLEDRIKFIKSEIELEKWNGLKNDDLRFYLYENGFTITTIDDKTGEIIENKYCVYKRSSSKSRTGQCLFIKERLRENMINWSRMYLKFNKDKEYDYAGILAYESLVGSSLEDTLEINVDNILIVNDIESKFERMCNVIKTNKDTDFLDNFEEKYDVVNSLFDGESLLESIYFKKGQSMNLLRQHMFKSAAFSTNIQTFLIEHCPGDQDYNTWEIANMFGEKIFAKNIKMICTPTSLKALKFAKDLDMTKKQMWIYWKALVRKEGNIFGLCKHEKSSKRGTDKNDGILQQTSYQMLNSMPIEHEDMIKLAKLEKEYIMQLKNDDVFFIEYVASNTNDINSNEMFVTLARNNKDFMNTKIFRDFRKHEINSYVSHCKKGKIRLNGDYCIAFGNPIEYLFHAIGKFDVETINDKELALKGNEIYTTLHEDGTELVCFRNPHTAPSNVLVAKNKYNTDINNYFNLTANVFCCNAIRFEIQDIASSMDYDSDSMVIFNNIDLLHLANKCFSKYNVCINDVKSEPKPSSINPHNMAIIDNQLSTSQANIGLVVNTGQLLMSTYWDLKRENNTVEEKNILNKLISKVNIATVLSCICIDLAKKFYDIDLNKEIRELSKGKLLKKKKPEFFKQISQSKTIKNRVQTYNCPMDHLQIIMDNIDSAKYRKNIAFTELLIKQNVKDGNRRQVDKILIYVKEMCVKINKLNAVACELDSDIEEKNTKIDDIIKYYNFYIQKLNVKEDTMYSILSYVPKDTNSKIQAKLLNILYTTQKTVFLSEFKVKKE
ncbi:hypothetical protein [Clostridium estertheticum]|uniref:hypothetical protein n=1 Tax=Clostridium estertheticum TaxID=238834 RepID=UPI001C0D72D3|nr:hypothetical protein [Clostridium estertheticum]MBU3186638.1 hypothetical protein [Clostridium estertheticum]